MRREGGDEMTTFYFGPRWDAPMLDEDAEQVPTPVGKTCYECGQAIAESDRGLIRACVRMVDGQPSASAEPIHVECDLRGIVGHEYGVCPCTGHGHSRADGLLVLERVNAGRATRGMDPL
jgi:hypothetical protein